MRARDEERTRKKTGAEPERLKVEVPFEEAVRRIIRARVPPGGVPERPKRERRGKVERGDT